MKHKLAGTAIAIGLLAACVSAQSTGQATGTVDGVVFTVDASGSHAVVPASRVSLDGPTHVEAESDGAGKFAFNAVPPGAYTINAQAAGLAANRTIEVTSGSASEIALEMKVQAVVESTTVTASTDQIDIKESPGTSTIGESAVRNMSNLDERFQSLLPLIPGVVRGPNGLINMKGAQASQNGSLLNSADVTDPATGTSALDIPIDVVSSVHVLSTPYDPEYGKFTGAVSNVETRPGSFNKFRISAQNLLPRLRRVDGQSWGSPLRPPESQPLLRL
jgi:Carboxypeptidase regulatory-like domain